MKLFLFTSELQYCYCDDLNNTASLLSLRLKHFRGKLANGKEGIDSGTIIFLSKLNILGVCMHLYVVHTVSSQKHSTGLG